MRQIFLATIVFCSLCSVGLTPALAEPSTGTSDKECVRCHKKMINIQATKLYVHKPFIEKKCTICHLAGKNPAQDRENQSAKSELRRPVKQKIHWISRHFDPSRVHWFLVPASQVDDTLFLQTSGDRNKPALTRISLPPVNELPVQTNNQQGPAIDGISFVGLQRGVFLSAIVQWHTDRPSGAQVFYGLKSSEENTTPFDPTLTTDHTLQLSPVLPGKNYQYIVAAQDVYGNVHRSNPHFFSTGSTYILPRVKAETVQSGKPMLEYTLSSVNGNYLLHVIADRPTFMTIGVHRELRKNTVITSSGLTGKEKRFRHPPMKSRFEVSMIVCKACHKAYWEGATHPVGVRPRMNMRIPKKYPVLADGRITCMSCHQFHGSNYEARMIQSSKKALCIGCHKNYG